MPWSRRANEEAAKEVAAEKDRRQAAEAKIAELWTRLVEADAAKAAAAVVLADQDAALQEARFEAASLRDARTQLRVETDRALRDAADRYAILTPLCIPPLLPAL
jgi:chromosome segregation ATPase